MNYLLSGNNHHNLLAVNQFNPESFYVVQQVYYSLENLRTIFNNLQMLNNIGSNTYKFEEVSKHICSIDTISRHIKDLINLEYNIPFLQEIAPRVQEFVEELNIIRDKLCLFDNKFDETLGLMETNTKHLEDLFVQYESGLQNLLEQYKNELCVVHASNMKEQISLHEEIRNMYSEIKHAVARSNMNAELVEEYRIMHEHLIASDLVTLAQFSGEELDYSNALKQIKQSEKYGTDETLNRARLKYKLTDNKVFDVLNANRERLTKEVTE